MLTMMVMVIMVVTMVMVVMMVMIMRVGMVVIVRMGLVPLLDPDLAFAAAANRAHQFTSSSLIRNSSPVVTCN